MDKILKRAELKQSDDGLQIVVSTEGVVDLDGDIMLKGSMYSDTPILMSPWGHDMRSPAVATGSLTRSGNQVLYTPKWLDTRASEDLQKSLEDPDFRAGVEASHAFIPETWKWVETSERLGIDFEKVLVYEVSLQYKGAGVGTGIKSWKLNNGLVKTEAKTNIELLKLQLEVL